MSQRTYSVLSKRYILPSEHGSWIWWIGPLLIGAAAAGSFTPDLLWLSLAMLAAFLFRQPAAILVKTYSKRRPASDRFPALFWVLIYAAIAASGGTMLLRNDFFILLYLLIPGIPVFLWHLWLVSRRAERGQRGVEIVGAGVLALAAPAAFWVSGGSDTNLAWILWALTWLQSAASIVLVYLRLEQRKQDAAGGLQARIQTGLRTLVYHLFNLALALLIYLRGGIHPLFVIAFALMLVDALDGIMRPAVRVKPTAIGIRQLIMSILFVVLILSGYLIV